MGTISPMSILRNIGRRLWGAYWGFQEHEGTLSASGIAYCVALSFFPLMLVLVAGLAWVLQWTAAGQDAQQELLATLEQQVSPELSNQVADMLKSVSDRAGTSGPIGFVVLVISAIVIFAQLDAAFDRIFKMPIDPHETWLHWFGRLAFQRVRALGMLLGVGGFIVLAMFTSTVLASMRQAVEPRFQMGAWVEWATSLWINLVLNIVAFTIIFRVVPRPYIRWRSAIQGGIVTAILWEAGRQALAAYFSRLNYPSAYGVIGSFLVVMLWAYYGAMVILFGAEYLRVTRDEAAKPPPASP